MMALRTHTIEKKEGKKSQIWEWEETPQLLEAIEQLQKSSQVVKDLGKIKKIHVVNTNFAPYKPRKKS